TRSSKTSTSSNPAFGRRSGAWISDQLSLGARPGPSTPLCMALRGQHRIAAVDPGDNATIVIPSLICLASSVSGSDYGELGVMGTRVFSKPGQGPVPSRAAVGSHRNSRSAGAQHRGREVRRRDCDLASQRTTVFVTALLATRLAIEAGLLRCGVRAR